MNCPNCNEEMKDKSYWYYGFGSWDMDYPDQLHEEYQCRNCKIKYINGEWTIPEYMIATEKQLNAGAIIERNTGISMPPPIKRLMCEYIGNNMELSKQRYEEYKKIREQNSQRNCFF